MPVQDIKVGDEVLSENAKTGKTEYQPVTALTHPHLDRLLEIRVEGEAEPLRPSTGHPFWVRSTESDAGHWVAAGKLHAGDFLETPTGGWRRVVSVQALSGEQTVYNFTVDQDHDYFVGQTGFLVHNRSCDCGSRREAFRTAKRELGIPMSSVPQVFGPSSPEFWQFGLNPSLNRRLYIFDGEGSERFGIREDWPAEYPTGPSQDPHFNYRPFDPEDPKSLSGHCYF